MKYGLSGKFYAVEDKGDELASILVEAAELMKKAKGCDLYIVGQESGNADVICITEVWHSKEDHDNSLNIDGVAELIGKARPLMAGKPESYEVDVHGGVGLG